MSQADRWGKMLPLHQNGHDTQTPMPICILVHAEGKAGGLLETVIGGRIWTRGCTARDDGVVVEVGFVSRIDDLPTPKMHLLRSCFCRLDH